MAYARSHPGRISFGSSGNYGTMHVPMEQLKAATSSFMLHVPYTGAGPAVLALLGGQIEALSTGPASVKVLDALTCKACHDLYRDETKR